MTLNLDKNKTVLVHAWKEVLDERNPINWALFGYDGQTYDLNLVAKGDGGLEEIIEEFNSGKIQYALVRVKIKEKNIEKIVIINWQGEGAPLARKGMAANHIETIKSFFKGIHVSVNARTDEDVEPDVILALVSKAVAGEGVKVSAGNVEENIGPVGTTYKRVNVQEEINAQAKDDFWRKDMAEEERRKREEVNRLRKFSSDDVKMLRKESQEYFDKEEQQQAQEKTNKSFSNSKSPTPAFNGAVNGTNNGIGSGTRTVTSPPPPTINTAERAAALQASTPMKNSNSDLVRKRIQSFDGSAPVFPQQQKPVAAKVNGGPKRFSNNNTNGPSISPAPSNTTTTNGTSAAPSGDSVSVSRRKALFESGGTSSSVTTTKRNPAEEIRAAQEAQRREEEKNKKTKPKSPSPAPAIAPQKEEEERVVSPVAHFSPSIEPKSISIPQQQQPAFFSNPTSAATVTPHPPQIEVEKESSPSPVAPISPPASFKSEEVKTVAPPLTQDNSVHSAQEVKSSSPATSNGSPLPPGGAITLNITPDMGVCARALYDYQAADETEITFDPGDIIRNIEKIDEGWWEGMGPGDQYGLFPSNYVEEIN